MGQGRSKWEPEKGLVDVKLSFRFAEMLSCRLGLSRFQLFQPVYYCSLSLTYSYLGSAGRAVTKCLV